MSSIITSLINHLSLQPNSSPINIHHYTQKSYIIYYTIQNHQHILISTHNYFKTLSQPNTIYLKHFDNLQQLQNFINSTI